jgi:predicted nucleotidyltransferase
VSPKIRIDYNRIAEFCRRWKVKEFALFGSVLRDDFRPDSDVDVLITLDTSMEQGLFEFVKMQKELSQLFGREVDLASRRGVESSTNHIRRNAILSSVEVLHAA